VAANGEAAASLDGSCDCKVSSSMCLSRGKCSGPRPSVGGGRQVFTSLNQLPLWPAPLRTLNDSTAPCTLSRCISRINYTSTLAFIRRIDANYAPKSLVISFKSTRMQITFQFIESYAHHVHQLNVQLVEMNKRLDPLESLVFKTRKTFEVKNALHF